MPIRINASAWLRMWPGMRLGVWATLPGGKAAYEAQNHMEGDVLVWDVTSGDTSVQGMGTVEIVGVLGDKISKTGPVRTSVQLTSTGVTGKPPESQQPWYASALNAAQRAEDAAKRAEDAGNASPEAIQEAVTEYLDNNPIQVTETDPTVPDWAKQPTKPSYTAEEVGALPADTVIPAPYTLPTASADTLGGVKVGEGLQMVDGALGVVPEDEYELIETITVEEDVTSIRRDVNLNAVMVLAEFAKASKDTNAFLAVTFVNEIRITGSNFLRTGGASSARYSVVKNSNYWDMSSNGYVRGWGSGQYYGQGNAADVLFVSDYPVITSLKLYASDGAAVIPTGSVIKILGVRANA